MNPQDAPHIWQKLEEQAVTAYREWPIWLAYRLRRLETDTSDPTDEPKEEPTP